MARARECGVTASPVAELKSNGFCTGSKAYRLGPFVACQSSTHRSWVVKSFDAANGATFGHARRAAWPVLTRRCATLALSFNRARCGDAELSHTDDRE
jgi:hypothetical protein